jgi:hypothetical protein
MAKDGYIMDPYGNMREVDSLDKTFVDKLIAKGWKLCDKNKKPLVKKKSKKSTKKK